VGIAGSESQLRVAAALHCADHKQVVSLDADKDPRKYRLPIQLDSEDLLDHFWVLKDLPEELMAGSSSEAKQLDLCSSLWPMATVYGNKGALPFDSVSTNIMPSTSLSLVKPTLCADTIVRAHDGDERMQRVVKGRSDFEMMGLKREGNKRKKATTKTSRSSALVTTLSNCVPAMKVLQEPRFLCYIPDVIEVLPSSRTLVS
jgi:hypothetical protein